MTLIEDLADWASQLSYADIPPRVVRLATSQVLSQLAAARAGMTHPLGQTVMRAFGPPLQPDPGEAARTLTGLTSWLHFDDTAYAGHLSNSTVTVPVTHAPVLRVDGQALVTAVVVANECAARVTAAATLGPFRGQSATFTHLAGAVAGRLHLQRASRRQWVDALGLAYSIPPRSIGPAFVGSDATAVTGSIPVRAGLDACDMAAAGLRGARDVLEHPEGFLDRFSTVALPEAVTAGLGTRWHTDTISFKVHPGGPGMDAAVDLAKALHARIGPLHAEDVEAIEVHASLYTMYTERRANAHAAGPATPMSALIFLTAYGVATALRQGDVTVTDFHTPALDDPARWALADKVTVTEDRDMTRALFTSVAPFGEAIRQAGRRAEPWLRQFGGLVRPGDDGEWLVELIGEPGPPSPDFTAATKETGARLVVRLRDGSEYRDELLIPAGAAGSPTIADHAGLVREKFRSTGGADEVADRLLSLPELDADELAALLAQALAGPVG